MVDAVFESQFFLIKNDRKLEAYATWGKLPACQPTSTQSPESASARVNALFALLSLSNLELRSQLPLIQVLNPSFGKIHIWSAK